MKKKRSALINDKARKILREIAAARYPVPPFSKEAEKAMANLANQFNRHCRIGKITMKG